MPNPPSGPPRGLVALVVIGCLPLPAAADLLLGVPPQAFEPMHVHTTGAFDDAGSPFGLWVQFTVGRLALPDTYEVEYRVGPGPVIEVPAPLVDVIRDLTWLRNETSVVDEPSRAIHAPRFLHAALIEDVGPGEAVRYRIVSEKGEASRVFTGHAIPSSSEPVRIVAFGDSDRAGVTHEGQPFVDAGGDVAATPGLDVMRAVEADDPDLVLIAGDLSYADDLENGADVPPAMRESNAQQAWGRWFNMSEPLFAKVATMPAPGNHETDPSVGPVSYASWWKLPGDELFYGFRAGPAYVVSLTSDGYCRFGMPNLEGACPGTMRGPDPLVLAQVKHELAKARASGAPWTIVMFHHPPYSLGPHIPDAAIHHDWVPLFEAAGVDVVVTGHDHNYQRSHPLLADVASQTSTDDYVEGSGIVYVTAGTGGRGLTQLTSTPEETDWAKRARMDFGYTVMDVTADTLSFEARFLGDAGAWDSFSITKAPSPPGIDAVDLSASPMAPWP